MEWLIENARDGTLLALIPEGEFLAGGSGRDEGTGPFPVRLPAYYLALHAVTNAQYARFLNQTKPTKTELGMWIELGSHSGVKASGNSYEPCGGNERHPVTRVSWYGAQAYCKWDGLRLPTELEWDKGARGTDWRDYPWGNEWDQNKCRHGDNRYGAETCNIWGYPAGNSPWGLYQMSGNVQEWCSDCYESGAYYRYKRGDLTPPKSGNTRVLKGGGWDIVGQGSFRCGSRDGYGYEPSRQFESIGFRCARDL